VEVFLMREVGAVARKSDLREVIQQLRTFRHEVRLEGLSLREMIEEGRRS
jgi:hypothetical protein